jgi:hypothetical protein
MEFNLSSLLGGRRLVLLPINRSGACSESDGVGRRKESAMSPCRDSAVERGTVGFCLPTVGLVSARRMPASVLVTFAL